MRGIARSALVFGFLVILSGCAGTPEIPYDHSTANVHTIGLPTPGFPSDASVVLASDVGQSFGLIGALVDAGMQSSRDSQFKDLLAKQNYTASNQFTQSLTAAMQQHGYTVVPIAVERKDSGLLKDMPPAPQPVDAYLDISVFSYGYIAAGIQDAAPYRPFMVLQCKLIKASDNSVLMQDRIDLNPVLPSNSKEVTLSPAPEYQFANFDTLMAQPDRAAEGLQTSVVQVATNLGNLMQ